MSKPLGTFCIRANTSRGGQCWRDRSRCSLAAANPVPALPAAPLATSSVFCEFIRPLLTTSQLSVSHSFLSCPGHDTEHAVQATAMPMLSPGPLSPQVPNKIPSLVLRRVQLSSWARNIRCFVGHTLTLSHSHPPMHCFGGFLCLLRNLWQPLNPGRFARGRGVGLMTSRQHKS